MTARECLEKPETLRREICRRRARIDALRRFSVQLSSPPREIRVRTSPDPSRMQTLLAEAADEEKQVLLLEEERLQALEDAALLISRLPDEKMIRVMELRYLEGAEWTQAARLLGYCASRTFRLHQLALSSLRPFTETAGADPA